MSAAQHPAPFLRVQTVCHDYAAGEQPFPALHNISFEVAAGEFVCIVGTSGSGKSTLLRILGGLIRPSSGTVWLGSEPVTEPPPAIGFVFQKSNLMPWRTVWENVLLPLEMRGKIDESAQQQAQDLLATVGLLDFAHSYPAQLSGGMAQRLALARALIQRPHLLLLDEPFGALDALTRERLNLELLEIQRRYHQTVVMVTHSLDEAVFLADRVLVLGGQPGEIVGQVAVDLPRPRTLETIADPRYGQVRVRVRQQIG